MALVSIWSQAKQTVSRLLQGAVESGPPPKEGTGKFCRLSVFVSSLAIIVLSLAALSRETDYEELTEERGDHSINLKATHPTILLGEKRVVDFAFILRNNTGHEILNLSTQNRACACQSVKLGKDRLAPNESTELTLTLDARAGAGFKTVHASVEGTLPSGDKTTWHCLGEVNILPRFECSEQIMIFNDLKPGECRRRQIKATIHLPVGAGLPKAVFRSTAGCVDVSPHEPAIRKSPERGLQSVEYAVDVSVCRPDGSGAGEILVEIDDPQTDISKHYQLRVVWTVENIYQVAPERVFLANPKQGDLTTLTIKRIDGHPCRVESATCAYGGLSLVTKATEDGGHVAIRFDKQVDSSRFEFSTIEIRMADREGRQRIKVPISILFPEERKP